MHSLSLSLSVVGTSTLADQTPIDTGGDAITDEFNNAITDESGNPITDT